MPRAFHLPPSDAYITVPPDHLRVYFDPDNEPGYRWCLDGVTLDNEGAITGFTEAVVTLPTWQEAIQAIPAFAARVQMWHKEFLYGSPGWSMPCVWCGAVLGAGAEAWVLDDAQGNGAYACCLHHVTGDVSHTTD